MPTPQESAAVRTTSIQPITPADGRGDRRRAAAPRRPRCRSGSTTGWRGRAIPAATRRSAPRASKCVAKLWRSACGVRLSGRPSRVRAAAHRPADEVGVERPALGPDEQRRVAGQRIGAQRDIGVDRLAHRRDQRHDPGLAALAGDPHRLAAAAGRARSATSLRRRAGPRRRAAAGSRGRARRSSHCARRAAASSAKRHRVVGAGGPRQGARPLRRAGSRQLRRHCPASSAAYFRKAAHRRHLARRRRRARARSPAGRRGRRAGRRRCRSSKAKRPISSPRWRPRNSTSDARWRHRPAPYAASGGGHGRDSLPSAPRAPAPDGRSLV